MKLQNGHIIIPAAIFESILQEEEQIRYVYYPDRKHYLFAAKSKTYFEKLHETKWTTLKNKNPQGDKSLYVREVLIDFDLDETDRELVHEIKNSGIILIHFT